MENKFSKGLTTHEANRLLALHGKNILASRSSFSIMRLFAQQFFTLINGILFLAACFFLISSDYVDGIFIVAIILLNALFGFIQEYKAEKSIEKLKTYTTPTVRVIRDGKEQEISSPLLVPGDTVLLSEGDRIPADGTLMNAHSIEIDESILTGESLPVMKYENNALYSGTLITKGKGYLHISLTGMNTKFGQIAQGLTTIVTSRTPLQKDLNHLGKIVSFLAVGTGLLLIPLGLLQGKDLIQVTFTAISIGIAAIPEGLPAVVTIALAVGTSRMAKRNAIVRQMPAVETLGATQIILVDKTGTLTQNTMRVKKFYLWQERFFTKLVQACVLGNTASLIEKADQKTFDIVGDRTDAALLLWIKDQHRSIDEILKLGNIIDEHVFDVRRKTITTVWEYQNKKHIFVRGAPEIVIDKCTLSRREKEAMLHEYKRFASDGLRVIGFATKEDAYDGKMPRDSLEKNLTFLGLIGIYDPPRPEVKKALANARQAGIRVIMVTGDNEFTALAIGKEIGLIKQDEDVVTGEELDKLSDGQLQQILTRATIFSRSKPQDKLRIATLLQKQGFIVAVTGDGVNDALALKKADVGVAMGQTGTDVAKEASDVVLTDDNFATLMKAVEEGRTIYQNIVKTVIYLLTSNLSELALVFGSSLLGLPAPLIPTQILFINLATDGLPALALAVDTKPPHVLSDKPRDPKKHILTTQRLLFITIRGAILSLFLIGSYAFFLSFLTEKQARTAIFTTLITSHLLLAFFLRGQSIFRLNKLLILATIGTLVLQIIIITTPFFKSLFQIGL